MLDYDNKKDKAFEEHIQSATKEVAMRFKISPKDEYSLRFYIAGIYALGAENGFKQAKEEIQNLMFGDDSK